MWHNAYGATRRVPPPVPASASDAPTDPLTQVKELAALHRDGVLTDAEFAAEKSKILGIGVAAAAAT